MPGRPRSTTSRQLDIHNTSFTTEEGTGGESHPEVRPGDSVDAHAPQEGLPPRPDSGVPVSDADDHLRPRADSGVSVSDDDDFDHDYDMASTRTYAAEDEGAVIDDSVIDEGHAPQESDLDSGLYSTLAKIQKPSAPSHPAPYPTDHDDDQHDDEPTYATATAVEVGGGNAVENNDAYEIPVPVSRPKLTNTQPNTPAMQQSPHLTNSRRVSYLTSDLQPDAWALVSAPLAYRRAVRKESLPALLLAAATANPNPNTPEWASWYDAQSQAEQQQAPRAAPTPLILATTTPTAPPLRQTTDWGDVVPPSPPGESTEQALPIPPIPPARSARTLAHFGVTPATAKDEDDDKLSLATLYRRTHQTPLSSQSAAANECYTCVGRYWGTIDTGLPFPGSEAFAPQDDRPVRQLIITAFGHTVRGMSALKVDRRCKAQSMMLTLSGDGTLKAAKSKSDAVDRVDNRHILFDVCESTSLLYHFHDVVVQRGSKKRRVAVLLCKNPITATIAGHVIYLKDGRSAALRVAIQLAQKKAFATTDA